jgi:hypothetical protein
MKSIFIALLIIFTFFLSGVQAQIETTILDSSLVADDNKSFFFTNRPVQIMEDNSISFKNKSTLQTNTLYFCFYNFATDSIEVKYRAINTSDKYPTEPLKYNVFYDLYRNARLERGIKNFYFVVGGYGKSFKKQVHSYMKRLKEKYGDELFGKAAIVVFAWGTEEEFYKYYNAVRKSKNGAADFAIFQHMLDEFVSDTAFFAQHPNDLTIDIMFSSMGNNLFKEYLEARKVQGIPLVKTYDHISFIGSVAPRNAFEPGKAFHELDQMADTVIVYYNRKDLLLKMSSVMQLKNRMGNKGPRKADKLPGYIKVFNVVSTMTVKDLTGLRHDYILTNPIIQNALLKSIEEDVEAKNMSQ